MRETIMKCDKCGGQIYKGPDSNLKFVRLSLDKIIINPSAGFGEKTEDRYTMDLCKMCYIGLVKEIKGNEIH